jgi:hypothetical protein
MEPGTSTELGLALREDEAGQKMIVCALDNGAQVHLTVHQARRLATHLIQLVARAELRGMPGAKGGFSRGSLEQPVDDMLPRGRYYIKAMDPE